MSMLPCQTHLMFEIDMIDSDIPLLLSQASMKQASMYLNFKEDTTIVFGETTDLVVIKSRHSPIPLTIPCRIVHNRNNENVNVTLSVQSNQDREKIAMKLHSQFT